MVIPPVRNADNTQYFLALFSLHTAIGFLAIRYAGNALNTRPLLLWTVFLASRFFIFPMLPWLSDDVYGYLWHGTLTINGWNCYVYPANAPEVAFLRNPLYDLLAYKTHPAIYPPVAEICIALGSWIGSLFSDTWQSALFGWKFVLFLAESVGFWLLLKTQKHVKFFSPSLYLLLPLPVVEIMGQAHNDGLLIAPLGGMMYILSRFWNNRTVKWEWITGALIGAMALIKLIPVVMILPFVRLKTSLRQKAILFISLGITSLTVSLIFFYDSRAISNFIEILQFYNHTQFNSPLLQLIRSILEAVHVPNWWLVAPTVISVFRLSVILMIGLVLKPQSYRGFSAQLLGIVTAATLISPKVHPWYFVPLLFLNSMVGWRWLAYGAQAMMLSYAMYAVVPASELFIVENVVWIGVICAALWEYRTSKVEF
ncbi:MAG: hypothetical protein IPM69_08130 [Ignavibacteria bacterium]|nr:hypothetical protein [Ignavibacteria bacterium]